MNPRPPVDKAFSSWLVQRSLKSSSPAKDRSAYSIAIQSPCTVCQPRVAVALAVYLNEFDDSGNSPHWLPVTDHRLEQLQAHSEFREMLGHDCADDPDSAIGYLSQQGGVILELPACHAQTADFPTVFQVSLSCKEPENANHHLWLNAKRISPESLISMIADAFFDWACHGGDLTAPARNNKNPHKPS
ncbi:hypothetical protein V2O64_07950 [Verrucomicrobiaceae bacterium 227]